MAIFNGDSLDIGSSFMGRKSRKEEEEEGASAKCSNKKSCRCGNSFINIIIMGGKWKSGRVERRRWRG